MSHQEYCCRREAGRQGEADIAPPSIMWCCRRGSSHAELPALLLPVTPFLPSFLSPICSLACTHPIYYIVFLQAKHFSLPLSLILLLPPSLSPPLASSSLPLLYEFRKCFHPMTQLFNPRLLLLPVYSTTGVAFLAHLTTLKSQETGPAKTLSFHTVEENLHHQKCSLHHTPPATVNSSHLPRPTTDSSSRSLLPLPHELRSITR